MLSYNVNENKRLQLVVDPKNLLIHIRNVHNQHKTVTNLRQTKKL